MIRNTKFFLLFALFLLFNKQVSAQVNLIFRDTLINRIDSNGVKNGKTVTYISKKEYESGVGIALNVKYDVNVKVVPEISDDIMERRNSGELSLVITNDEAVDEADKNAEAFADCYPFQNTSVITRTQIKNASLTAEDIITHEVGHNMQQLNHPKAPNGEPIYPPETIVDLESNTSGMCKPNIENTKQIIKINVEQEKRLAKP